MTDNIVYLAPQKISDDWKYICSKLGGRCVTPLGEDDYGEPLYMILRQGRYKGAYTKEKWKEMADNWTGGFNERTVG